MKLNYYTIFLILDSDNEPIYNYNRYIWKQYMNTNSEILCIFIKYNNKLQKEIEYVKDSNTLYIKGNEQYNCQNIYNILNHCYII